MMRLSRPCYDKYHRCPGWVGGGMHYAKRMRCSDGRIVVNYEDRLWRWKFQRCNTCNVVVLPYNLVQLAPANVWWRIKFFLRNR
jgi:hypothetical protein